jgi:hypothetical protein
MEVFCERVEYRPTPRPVQPAAYTPKSQVLSAQSQEIVGTGRRSTLTLDAWSTLSQCIKVGSFEPDFVSHFLFFRFNQHLRARFLQIQLQHVSVVHAQSLLHIPVITTAGRFQPELLQLILMFRAHKVEPVYSMQLQQVLRVLVGE